MKSKATRQWGRKPDGEDPHLLALLAERVREVDDEGKLGELRRAERSAPGKRIQRRAPPML